MVEFAEHASDHFHPLVRKEVQYRGSVVFHAGARLYDDHSLFKNLNSFHDPGSVGGDFDRRAPRRPIA
jgi:hypothetical protein